MSKNVLELFHPLIQSWFKKGIGNPTDIQKQAWPAIASGEHILATAPTGSGKTLTAFLWAINQLITGKWSCGQTRVIYISPMKALNNDIQKNLMLPLNQLRDVFEKEEEPFPKINVLTRSGDTSQQDRRTMLRRPPEILITTPESLNILLTSKNNRLMLSGIETVILDEIHSVAETKRGTHLITAVDRLILLCGEFQRIALSATVRPLSLIAEFIGGYKMSGSTSEPVYKKRPVKIIESGDKKKYDIKVAYPDDIPLEGDEDSWWHVLTKSFKKHIHENKSTILFTNSRRMTEKITRFINENEEEELAYAHHGSLSKEIRLAIEQKLKQGELKSIVATNSLELGIDIGVLDKVLMVQTPGSIASSMQRIGRSGHNVGDISSGVLYPIHGKDFLYSAVLAKLIDEHDIENLKPVQAPLDVLSQVILSMSGIKKWDIDELYVFLKTSTPYHNLSRKQYDLLLNMLAGRYADTKLRELNPRLSIDKIDNTIQAKKGATYLLYMSGGTIPDRGYYNLRLQDSKAKIGELDEEFVWERSLGDTFVLGTQLWQIQRITHNDVEVVPSNNTLNIIPFWKAEPQNRSFYLSEKIAEFLEEAEISLNKKELNEKFKDKLIKKYFMEDAAADALIDFLKYQKESTDTALPHRHNILIEHFDDPLNKSDSKQVILHTLWGGYLNRPFSFALAAAWEKKYKYPIEIFSNNDSIMIMFPHEFAMEDLFNFVSPDNLEELLRIKLEKTGYFGAHFRENAGRSLLLPKPNFNKRMPLWINRLRGKKLLKAVKSYKDFPIVLETWRTCLQDEFDLENLKLVLNEINEGKIKITSVVTKDASAFAEGLIWRQTNKFMYEDDSPDADSPSNLSQELIKELLSSSHLRPKIPLDLIRILNGKLKRTAVGYTPSTSQDMLDWIKERLLIPHKEYLEIIESLERDNQSPEILQLISDKLCWYKSSKTAEPLLFAAENISKLTSIFSDEACINNLFKFSFQSSLKMDEIILEKGVVKYIDEFLKQEFKGDKNLSFNEYETFITQWLSYYGPVKIKWIQDILGVEKIFLDSLIEGLKEEGVLIVDRISKLKNATTKELEVCDSENLEILLRMARRARQPKFSPLPIKDLPLFLSSFHGITQPGSSKKNLQDCLEKLFGYPAPAQSWEEFILPVRLEPYYTSWMDTLMQTNNLCWFGCGKKKTSFAFLNDMELFTNERQGDKKEGSSFLPDKNNTYDFAQIMKHNNIDSVEGTEKLWEKVWNSSISNDTYQSLRQGILNGFAPYQVNEISTTGRRSRLNRWKNTRPFFGKWFSLINESSIEDPVMEMEIIRDRIHQLFFRYGVLFKELISHELPKLKWARVFRQLRLMELSGEILSGVFFKDIPGIQFISYEAYRILQTPLPEDAIYCINAVDPASVCGISIDGLWGRSNKSDNDKIIEESIEGDKKVESNKEGRRSVRRIMSNFLIYHGSKLVVIAKRNGINLEILVEPDNQNLKDYLYKLKFLVNREFNPLKSLFIKKINGESAVKSPFNIILRDLGFKQFLNGFELRKVY